MTAEGVFPKSDGDVLYASEINALHATIKQVYTGTGFNSTHSGGGSDTQDHEMDAVSSTINSYVKVRITATHTTQETNGSVSTSLKAQIKETGEAYADIISYKTILSATGSSTNGATTSVTYEVIATLTSDQKTNGYQIKVFSTSTTGEAGISASVTNIQTVVEEAS